MPKHDDASSPFSFTHSRHARPIPRVDPPAAIDAASAPITYAATLPPQELARLRALIAVHERRLGGSLGTAPLAAVVAAVAADLKADPVLDAAVVAWGRNQIAKRDRRTQRSVRSVSHRTE